MTNPPLNAPTGLRTGIGVAISVSLLEDVWKLRDAEGVAMERIAGENMRDAIVTDGKGRERFVCCQSCFLELSACLK